MQIEVRLLQDAITGVVGGTLNVTVAVRNTGVERQKVHSTQTELPFEYEISSASGEVVQRLSVRAFRHATSRQGLRALAPQPYFLEPGQELCYPQDLAAITLLPLEPGTYRLTAHYPTFDGSRCSSPSIPLSIRIPSLLRSTQVVGQSGEHLGSAFVAALEAGTAVVFERESAAARAQVGIIRERGRADDSSPITGVALATEVDAPRDWRWLGWTRGTAFAGVVCWDAELPIELAPASHGLLHARLIERAFQWGDAEGLFLLLGEVDGQGVLCLVRLAGRAAPRFQHVPLGLVLPRTMSAGVWSDATDNLEVVRAYETVGSSGTLETRLSAARLSLSNPSQFAHTRPLGTYSGSLVALSVAPLVTGANPLVDALCQTTPEASGAGRTVESAAVYVRVPLLGGDAQRWSIPLLPPLSDGSPRLIDAWAICAIPHGAAPVVARAGCELWYVLAADPSARWTLLERRETGILAHHVENFAVPNGQEDGPILVTFFDAKLGLCTRTIAPFDESEDLDAGESIEQDEEPEDAEN